MASEETRERVLLVRASLLSGEWSWIAGLPRDEAWPILQGIGEWCAKALNFDALVQRLRGLDRAASTAETDATFFVAPWRDRMDISQIGVKNRPMPRVPTFDTGNSREAQRGSSLGMSVVHTGAVAWSWNFPSRRILVRTRGIPSRHLFPPGFRDRSGFPVVSCEELVESAREIHGDPSTEEWIREFLWAFEDVLAGPKLE